MGNASPQPKEIPNPLEVKVTKEWKALEEIPPPPATHFTSALAGENVDKNRYPRVLAPDTTRVKLKPVKGKQDYINANFIDGIHSNAKQAYIATQAPKPDTIKDFWRMIWEQDVRILVMLTNLEEGGKPKANLYWPNCGSKAYGNITVTFQSVEHPEEHEWCVRRFTIRCGGNGLKNGTTMVRVGDTDKPVLNQQVSVECRTVYQYHYRAWPDMGVPEMPPLLEMMSSVNVAWLKICEENNGKSNKCPPPSPMVVHCSAGIGRTGAYLLIHTCVSKLLEENKPATNLELLPILTQMREQRPGLIQQKDQYMFCYKVIQYAIDGVEQAPSPTPSSPSAERKSRGDKSSSKKDKKKASSKSTD